ncbi:glutamate--tRNA ligase, partial [Candidatus Dependentiae bacterium]|nr:glutamate--tRNA ligase [Candidatus Dependentiae bacterium]
MNSIRVRFAPSPTGFMHLGNVRAALMNFLFAKQKKGTFILRIEDTDAERNLDEAKQRIIQDLHWLGLTYTEGPDVGGDFGPYEQSARANLYQEKLAELIRINRIYRCFCTPEQLEIKRKEQLAASKPPRYDRHCLRYPQHTIKQKLDAGLPFIWRFKINEQQTLSIDALNGATIDFNMEHFSDFAITRSDGSYTFIFVNFVDDWLMQISHVIRGEDHLSNT